MNAHALMKYIIEKFEGQDFSDMERDRFISMIAEYWSDRIDDYRDLKHDRDM